MRVGEMQIEESDEKKLLGVTLDKKLSMKKHALTLCKKASQKLQVLTRISIYMEPEKFKLLMNTFAIFTSLRSKSLKKSYCLRCSEKLQLPKAKTTGLGIDTVDLWGESVTFS